jgi:hypothetical protein
MDEDQFDNVIQRVGNFRLWTQIHAWRNLLDQICKGCQSTQKQQTCSHSAARQSQFHYGKWRNKVNG